MKTLHLSLTSFVLIVCMGISLSSVFGQCNPATPLTDGQYTLPNQNVLLVSLDGNTGQDYFSFTATVGSTYVFTTMGTCRGQVFGVANNDTQISIRTDATPGAPAPGLFGQDFHDDYNIGQSNYDAFMVWSPAVSGVYRVILTTYNAGQCVELAAGQSATIAAYSFPYIENFSVWTQGMDTDWNDQNNWYSRATGGFPTQGRPTSMADNHAILLNGISIVAIHDSCQSAYMFPSSGISMNSSGTLHLLDTTTVFTTNPQITGAGNARLFIKQDFNYSQVNIPHVICNGRKKQTIGLSNNSPTYTSALTIDNPKGVRLRDNLFINDSLVMKNGIMEIVGTNFLLGSSLHMIPGAQFVGGSDSSHINTSANYLGYLEATTNGDVHTFPIGDGNRYKPITISSGLGDMTWEVLYAPSGYGNYETEGTGLHHVSQLEYWSVYESSLSSNPVSGVVTLHWDPTSQVKHDYRDIVAARQNQNNKWELAGNLTRTGNNASGTIDAEYSLSPGFGNFTLGSSTSNNPMPLDYPILEVDKTVSANWLTWLPGNLSTFDYFEVERSHDGAAFESITRLKKEDMPRDVVSFEYLDLFPIEGTTWYRIKEVSIAGGFIYSEMQQVKRKASVSLQVSVFPNPVSDYMNISWHTPDASPVTLQLISSTGQVVYQRVVTGGLTKTSLNTHNFTTGMYRLLIGQHGKQEMKSIMIH